MTAAGQPGPKVLDEKHTSRSRSSHLPVLRKVSAAVKD